MVGFSKTVNLLGPPHASEELPEHPMLQSPDGVVVEPPWNELPQTAGWTLVRLKSNYHSNCGCGRETYSILASTPIRLFRICYCCNTRCRIHLSSSSHRNSSRPLERARLPCHCYEMSALCRCGRNGHSGVRTCSNPDTTNQWGDC